VSRLPQRWAELVDNVNGRTRFGQRHVRDPEAPCEMFEPVDGFDFMGTTIFANGDGDCDTDGHYLCVGCVHLSERAMLERAGYPEVCST